MRTFVEVIHGAVRCVFEADKAPYGMPGTCFVDVTEFEPKPKVGYEYDPAKHSFTPSNRPEDPYDPLNIADMWIRVRNTRNTMLNLSDYTQTVDFPDKVLQRRYREYRQDLRDIPLVFNDPYAVVFPCEPRLTNIKLTQKEKIWYVWDYIRARLRARNKRRS